VLLLPALAGNHDGEDYAVIVGANPVAIDQAPLVASGGLVQVLRVPVNHLATAPIFVADFCAFLPFVVLHVLLVVFLIRMVLSEGSNAAGKGDSEGGNGKNSAKSVHFDSSWNGIQGGSGMLFGEAAAND
jgi:hypothetical protein